MVLRESADYDRSDVNHTDSTSLFDCKVGDQFWLKHLKEICSHKECKSDH